MARMGEREFVKWIQDLSFSRINAVFPLLEPSDKISIDLSDLLKGNLAENCQNGRHYSLTETLFPKKDLDVKTCPPEGDASDINKVVLKNFEWTG